MPDRKIWRRILAVLACGALLLPGQISGADGAVARFGRARAHYEKWLRNAVPKELDDALMELTKARKERPKEALFPQWIGFIKLQQKKYDEAILPLNDAIVLNPASPEPFVNLGYAYTNLGRYPDAIKSYEQSIPLIKKDALAHPEGNTLRTQLRRVYTSLGEVNFHQKRFPEALTAFQHAADLDSAKPAELTPKELTLYNDADRRQQGTDAPKIQDNIGVAQVTLASLNDSEADSRLKEAVTAYETATRLNPNNPLYWQHQGNAYQAIAARAVPGSDAERMALKQASDAFAKATDLVRDDFVTRERYAAALVEQGNNEEALRQFAQAQQSRQAVQQVAATPALTHFYIGLAHARLEHWQAAEDQFALAAAAEPNNARPLQWLGFVRLQQNKYDGAIEALQAADHIKPNVGEVLLNLSRVYEAQKNYDKATEELESVTKIQPDLAIAWYNLGGLYNRRMKYPEAAAAFQKALQLDPKGKEISVGLAYSGLGFALHKVGIEQPARLQEALAANEKATQINPANTESWIDLAYTYFDIAQDDGTLASWQKAADALSLVMMRAPDTPKIHDVYAYALSKANRKGDAISEFDRGLPLDKKPYEFLVALAVDLDAAMRYSAAEDVYKKALEAYSQTHPQENVLLLAVLGQVQRKQKKIVEAEATYAHVTEIAPDDINAALIRYNLLLELQQKPKALAVLEDTLRVNGSKTLEPEQQQHRGVVRSTLAYNAYLKGDKANLLRAKALYTDAIKDAPKTMEPYNGLGVTLVKLKQPEQAVFYLKKAVAIAPSNDEAYNNLGVAYENANNLEQAAASYRTALKINPHNSDARRNLNRYAALLKQNLLKKQKTGQAGKRRSITVRGR